MSDPNCRLHVIERIIGPIRNRNQRQRHTRNISPIRDITINSDRSFTSNQRTEPRIGRRRRLCCRRCWWCCGGRRRCCCDSRRRGFRCSCYVSGSVARRGDQGENTHDRQSLMSHRVPPLVRIWPAARDGRPSGLRVAPLGARCRLDLLYRRGLEHRQKGSTGIFKTAFRPPSYEGPPGPGRVPLLGSPAVPDHGRHKSGEM